MLNDKELARTDGPLVSVCVQTYQHAAFIRKCIDGILMQKGNFDLEILLGEDDSSDGTRQICVEYANDQPDTIRLFLHDRKNVIYIGGRPTGRYNVLNNLQQARGKYIAYCEGDDYWTDPEKIAKQVEFLEQNEACVACYHNARLANEDGQLLDQWKIPAHVIGKQREDTFVSRIGAPMGTVMFRRSAIRLPPVCKRVPNLDTFLLGVIGASGKSVYLEDIGDSIATIHGGGVWSSRSQIQKQSLRLQTFHALLEHADPEFRPEILKIIRIIYLRQIRLAAGSFEFRSFWSGVAGFLKSMRFNPVSICVFVWLAFVQSRHSNNNNSSVQTPEA